MKKIFVLILLLTVLAIHAQKADSGLVLKHLNFLCDPNHFRNYNDMRGLNRAADYIYEKFNETGLYVSEQRYYLANEEFRNVILSTDTVNNRRIVIGAHYDVFKLLPGADDNASGTVALLELARLLKYASNKNFRIDLVAFTNEEPPFFGTSDMGSYKHAKWMYEIGAEIKMMASIDMIGYFSTVPGSQKYPCDKMLKLHGDVANFLGVIDYGGKYAEKFSTLLSENQNMKFIRFTKKEMPTLGLSDHINYIKYGFPSVMVTNTAFYRTPNYHTAKDKVETIDVARLTASIQAIYEVLLKL